MSDWLELDLGMAQSHIIQKQDRSTEAVTPLSLSNHNPSRNFIWVAWVFGWSPWNPLAHLAEDSVILPWRFERTDNRRPTRQPGAKCKMTTIADESQPIARSQAIQLRTSTMVPAAIPCRTSVVVDP